MVCLRPNTDVFMHTFSHLACNNNRCVIISLLFEVSARKIIENKTLTRTLAVWKWIFRELSTEKERQRRKLKCKTNVLDIHFHCGLSF